MILLKVQEMGEQTGVHGQKIGNRSENRYHITLVSHNIRGENPPPPNIGGQVRLVWFDVLITLAPINGLGFRLNTKQKSPLDELH